MREYGGFLRVALVSALLVIPLACSGDGGGPVDPGGGNGNGNGFNVSGTWTVTATVVESTCDEIEVGLEETTQVMIVHQGDQISFILEGLGAVTGTIDVDTGQFEIEASLFVPGMGTLSLEESGRFTSETDYTSEETVTFEDPLVACQFRTMDVGMRTST